MGTSRDAGRWQEGALLPQTSTISVECLTVPQRHSTSVRAGENHKYIQV